VKKCASCSKDLPEAALHCVFCGAKQAPAPAVPASAVAKTAFGYSANEVMAQLGQQQQQPAARPQPAPAPAPRAHPGSQPPPPAGYPQPSGLAPQAAANAATMFVPGGGPPPGAQQQYGSPQPQAYSPSQPQYGNPSPGFGNPSPGFGAPSPGYPQAPAPYSPPQPSPGLGIHAQQQVTPAPLPAVPQPYLGAHTGVARAGRPIEPWKDSLKLMMFIWGAIALAAFATPVLTEPMAFNWDAILHAPGSAKIPALVWAGVGLLSIVFAAMPMQSLPRGALAAVLGLAGVFVPMAVAGKFGEPLVLLQLIGMLVLVPGLLIRHEYTESLAARVMVTIGVICGLLLYLVPQGGQIPLVGLFKALLNAGSHMELVIVPLAQLVLLVLCLLVWMPGPATAGAKIFAWIVLVVPVAAFLLFTLADGNIGDLISKAPGTIVSWVPGVAYAVLVGYGGATVIGKQLE
jgi:hypothetical protein